MRRYSSVPTRKPDYYSRALNTTIRFTYRVLWKNSTEIHAILLYNYRRVLLVYSVLRRLIALGCIRRNGWTTVFYILLARRPNVTNSAQTTESKMYDDNYSTVARKQNAYDIKWVCVVLKYTSETVKPAIYTIEIIKKYVFVSLDFKL